MTFRARSPFHSPLTCGAALLAAALLVSACAAQTVPPAASSIFPPVGLVRGQAARLNLQAAGAPCNATLSFADASGATLTSRALSLAAGQASYLDQLYPPGPAGRRSSRKELTASFSAIADPTGAASGCQESVEVFDRATGDTRFATACPAAGVPITAGTCFSGYLPGSAACPNPASIAPGTPATCVLPSVGVGRNELCAFTSAAARN